MEELVEENVRLLEERDTLMLKLSTVMRQLEGSRAASAMSSMAGSRSTTPLPQGSQQVLSGDHFDPHAEIRELHSKLEELRRLNYSLDVELQKERGERQDLGNRSEQFNSKRNINHVFLVQGDGAQGQTC